MYNDEQNLYHYTYRKDGTEPGQRYDAKQPTVDEQLNSYRQQQEQQTQNSQPVYQSQPQGGQTPHKNGKNRLGLKIASLALVCALLGGLVGGGTAYLVSNSSSSNTTEVNVSNRKPTEIQLKTVDGKNPMTDAELYAANVNSVVSINVTGSSGTNFFGQTVETASSGSGFILTTDGYIVTNYHPSVRTSIGRTGPDKCVHPSALQPSFFSVLETHRNLRFSTLSRRICRP